MRTAGGCFRLLESSETVLYRPVRSIQVRKRQISFTPPLILLFLAQLTDNLLPPILPNPNPSGSYRPHPFISASARCIRFRLVLVGSIGDGFHIFWIHP